MFRKNLFLIFMSTGLLLASSAYARVFSFGDAGAAAFVHGSGGTSQLNQDAFANSNQNTKVDGKGLYHYGGELGAVFSLSPKFHFRLGVEGLQHSPVSKGKGINAAGTDIYTIDSSVFIFNPNIAFEYVYKTNGNIRYYVELGAGMAQVTVVNSYKMVGTGATELGVGDVDEKMEANVISGLFGLGLETLFTDNVTFMVDFGYRYLPVTNLKYKGDGPTVQTPAGVTKGSPVTNMDGGPRKLNLSGAFVGVTFRFYLHFM